MPLQIFLYKVIHYFFFEYISKIIYISIDTPIYNNTSLEELFTYAKEALLQDENREGFYVIEGSFTLEAKLDGKKAEQNSLIWISSFKFFKGDKLFAEAIRCDFYNKVSPFVENLSEAKAVLDNDVDISIIQNKNIKNPRKIL